MQVKYNLVVDFARPTKSNTIIVSEGDVNSRLLHFTLLANKTAFDMIDVNVATVRGVKQDGSVIYGDATIITDDEGQKLNEIEYVLPLAVTDTAGKVTMTITLLANTGEQITSFEFYITTRNALYNEDDYIEEEDLNGFRDLLNRCLTTLKQMEVLIQNDSLPNPFPLDIEYEGKLIQYNGSSLQKLILNNLAYIGSEDIAVEDAVDESAASKALKYAEIAKESASEAEEHESNAYASKEMADNAKRDCTAYAIGERDGAYVTSEDPAYHNNAKYYAELCQSLLSNYDETIERIKQAIRDLGGDI